MLHQPHIHSLMINHQKNTLEYRSKKEFVIKFPTKYTFNLSMIITMKVVQLALESSIYIEYIILQIGLQIYEK